GEAGGGCEQRPRFELPNALTAQLRAVGEPGLGEHVQVLRDRLSGDATPEGQPGDGRRALRAEPGDDPKTGLVTQRREDRSCRCQLLRPNHPDTARWRPSAGPSPLRSRGMPPLGATWGCRRSLTPPP